mgnify:FL=1
MPISIHALREEGDFLGLSVRYDKLISIHALREEGDPFTKEELKVYKKISIHALREEGDKRPNIRIQ